MDPWTRDIHQNCNFKQENYDKLLDFGVPFFFFDKPQLGISWKLKSCTFPVSVHVPPNLRKEVKGAIHLLKFWGCPQKMQLQPMWPHQFWQPSVLSTSRAAAKGGHQPTKSCCFAAAFLFELFLWTLMNSAIVFQWLSWYFLACEIPSGYLT